MKKPDATLWERPVFYECWQSLKQVNMKIAVSTNETTLVNLLNTAGYTVIPFNNVKELQYDPFDMFIVDNDISHDAINLITNAREKCPVVLFIASHFSETEIVAALNAGASDYLIKPLRRNELLTRIEVLWRRIYPDQVASENLVFGHYVVEPRFGRISFAGHHIELTRKEFDLALLLFRHLGKPLSRATMSEAVWSGDSDMPSRTLDTHISRVRNKLQLRPENGFQLIPVYGFGYQLEMLEIKQP